LVEQLFRKQQVARSIRVAGSILPHTSAVLFSLTELAVPVSHPEPGLRASLLRPSRIRRHSRCPTQYRSVRVRLRGINCPGKGQAYGNKAKLATSALVFGKDVTIQTHGKDKYKRTLADVLLPDGTNVNHEPVKEGWCWWYRRYAPGDTVLEQLEQDARKSKKGIWADPHPVPLWE
jgi:endonuclease YncB( thermonuclease family)